MKASTHFKTYSEKVSKIIDKMDWDGAERLAQVLLDIHAMGKRVFVCGNGGSAANAMHLANDLLYGSGLNMNVEALPANTAVLTCLANDRGYDDIFAQQITAKGQSGDLLIVLSGSGNSPNIIEAIKAAQRCGMVTSGILGYSGGLCKELIDIVVHVEVDDMQIAEDFQMMLGHMITQWLAMSKHELASLECSPLLASFQ